MDAPNPSTQPTFASRAPIHVGGVGLRVRDLDRAATFYREVIGLTLIEGDPSRVRLGAGDAGFLQLTRHPDAALDDGRSAGLYHTAFLMPTRADLARWVMHIANNRTPITGASDHGVSEAFYLDDPEGNGIEVYADRPPESWTWTDGLVSMPTIALDIGKLVSLLGDKAEPYRSAPSGMRIGHVHLRVGELEPAERFYSQGVGLEVTRKRHGAVFMSSGHYHHHVAANVWQSAGAGMRDPNRAGLDWLGLTVEDAGALDAIAARLAEQGATVAPIDGGVEAADPWGTALRLTRR